jgi:hypothetical protein
MRTDKYNWEKTEGKEKEKIENKQKKGQEIQGI